MGLRIEGYPAPVEVLAEVTTTTDPRAADAARCSSCTADTARAIAAGADGEPSGDWPCSAGWRPVPSHTGYRYITDVLASQGYLTVSISANGINGTGRRGRATAARPRARNSIRHHLALWAGVEHRRRRSVGRSIPRAASTLARLVLVGHSRGGGGRRARDDRQRCRRSVAGPRVSC